MALTQLEQWQLLAWLLYQKSSRSLDALECVALHHLLMACVGENYQKVICEPPPESPGRISLNISPDQLAVHDAVSSGVLCGILELDADGIAPQLLLQNHIQACSLSSADYISALYERYVDTFMNLPAITPQPLVATGSVASERSGKWQRKWKKFRRDPALFFKDFFRKRGR